jgi:5-methylcytosine-specific restriction endonuclease McrA
VGVLERSALVLNRNWQPVHVTSVARGLALLWADAARAIDPESYRTFGWEDWLALEPAEGEPFLRTGRRRVRAPEVLVLARYDRTPRHRVAFSRRNVARRDGHACQYCGARPGLSGLTIDHVVPRSRGGPSNWTNCVAACIPCNARKADRTPEQAGMRLRRAPTRPEWRPFLEAGGPRIASWARFLAPEPALALA